MDKSIYFDKSFIKKLENKRFEIKDARGANIEEVKKIESYFNLKLPKAYIEFLLLFGHGGGNIMKGSSVFLDELFELKNGAEELLIENDFPKKLHNNDFVFWMHQGYQFAFFNSSEHQEDPSVFFYYEQKTKVDFEDTKSTFSKFIKAEILLA